MPLIEIDEGWKWASDSVIGGHSSLWLHQKALKKRVYATKRDKKVRGEMKRKSRGTNKSAQRKALPTRRRTKPEYWPSKEPVPPRQRNRE